MIKKINRTTLHPGKERLNNGVANPFNDLSI